MMVEQSVESTEPQAVSQPWYKIWAKVYFFPKEQTYETLLQDSNAKTSRAIIWVGISILVIGIAPILLYWVSGGRFIHDDLVDAGITSQGEIALFYSLIGVFFAALIGAPIGMGIATSLIHWLATKMGGDGIVEKFGFLLGAIVAPAYLIDSAIEGITGNNFIGLGLRMALSIYQAFLLFTVLKANYKLTKGKALGVILVLAVAFVIIVGCLLGSLVLLRG
jgi:hypothetical protein